MKSGVGKCRVLRTVNRLALMTALLAWLYLFVYLDPMDTRKLAVFFGWDFLSWPEFLRLMVDSPLTGM